ncbi:MAG TPA: pre-peptidase C-terminal domain-containing protein [Pyrinomonadaceae bacterium]|jgi:hypothetical protein
MRKLLLATGVCALLALAVLPSALLRPTAAQKERRSRPTQTTPPAPPTRTQVRPQTQPSATQAAGQSAEAFTTAPGVVFDHTRVKESPAPKVLREAEDAEDEAESEPESDIDPETLERLKRQPYRAPTSVPPSYTKQQDGAAKRTRTPTDRQPFAPVQVRSFAGVGVDEEPDGFLHRPPDPDMAAGPAHVVTVVNSIFAVYDKSGTRLQIDSLTTRFNAVCSTCSPFDPRIAYDPVANRWIMIALHHNDGAHESSVLISVSQTSDPTGQWWNYKLDAVLNYNGEDTWADYPDVGFDGITAENGGAVYVTTNQFTFGTNSSRTAALYILPKSALYAGTPLNFWRAFDHRNADNSQSFTLRPAKTYGNSGVEYLTNSRNFGSFVSVWRVVPTYPPTPVDWTLQTTINTGPYSIPPEAAQAGCGSSLSTIDNRIYNAVWRNNRLYAAFTEAHDWGGGGGTVAAIRYLKINTTTNAAEINQTYGADGVSYYLPAIAVDSADNIVLVFARSGFGEFGSLRYTGRLTTDTQIQSSTELKAGVQCLTGGRYGDYQGAAVDPADPTKVWVYGQWAADTPPASSVWDWGTWIGQVQFGGGPSCNYSIAPTAASAPAAGTSGSITVTTTGACAWTATSNVPWLTISSGAAGTGNGTVNYTVAANTTTLPRTGVITIGDQIFTITQTVAGCNATPIAFGQTVSGALATTDCRATFRTGSFADRYSFSANAGQQIIISMSGSFDTYLFLLGPAGTQLAFDDDGGPATDSRIPTDFGSFTLPATGTYTIEATSFSQETIGNYTLTLVSAGQACTYALTQTAQNFTADGGSNSVGVTAGAGCNWTASNNGNNWITITAGSSGTGNGTVNYSVAANPNSTPRSGSLTIAGLNFTVTQDAAPCLYSIAPTSQLLSAAAGGGSVTVTVNAGCPWSVVNNSNFITVTSANASNGNGIVSYTVPLNTTGNQRTGTLTIAGQTFTVTQAAAGGATCTPAAIGIGQTSNSTLATSDCRATFRNNSYADRYTFNGVAGQQVSISLSAAFDTYLFLLAPDGTVAALNDDDTGTTNSRIPTGTGSFTLPVTGTYTIEATSLASNTTGNYALTLSGTTPAATLQFSAAGYSESEGNVKAAITVTRTGDASGPATVVFATVDDPAAVPCNVINAQAYARCDYATTVDTLTFAPGVTTRTINIPLIDDVYNEGNETVQLALANPAGATLGAQSNVTLTITDNDSTSAANPVFSSPFFVRQQYLDFLSREPDTPGFNAWLNVLNGCPDVNNLDPGSPSAQCDRILVSSSFFGSQEFQLKGFFVFRFYKVAFGRLPQYAEIVADMRAVTGSTAQEVFTKKAAFSNAFTQRPAFTVAYGALTNADYVTALMSGYGLTQITTPDPSAPDGTTKVTLTTIALVNRLDAQTMTRAQVLRALADSDEVNTQEFQRAFVGMQYYGYLRRTPDVPGYNAWLNYLTTHPTDFRTMVNGFMNSQEYRLRFGAP